MCYVNFVRESTAFMRHACDQGLTANERLLWYALFHTMNARAKGSDWPEGLVPIPNKQLLSLVPFGEDSLIAARNKLKQRGLIDYQPGKKNAAPPMYKMVYFAAELSTSYEQNWESYPDMSGNVQGNNWGNARGNVQGNNGGNTPGNMPGIILNYKPNDRENRNPLDFIDDEDDDVDAARVREERIRQMYRQCIGRAPTTLEIGQIWAAWNNTQAEGALVDEAIQRAAMYGAKAPAMYAKMLLYNWQEAGIRRMSQLVETEHGKELEFLDSFYAKEE